jgi:hypothetical protein
VLLILLMSCGGDVGLVAEGHNDPPHVELLSPSSGASLFVGDALAVEASYRDPDGDDALVRVHWSSSLDGPLQGASELGGGLSSMDVSSALNPGVHLLVALAVDERGGTDADQVELTVINPDVDGDGYWATAYGGDDCRDDNPTIHPGAEDICDDVDQDCDGDVDEDATVQTLYPDQDGDGTGAPEPSVETCAWPDGWMLTGTDCDDADATRIDCVSCKAIRSTRWDQGDGLYTIDPVGTSPFPVYCDMTTGEGGWTLVGTNAFDRAWSNILILDDAAFGSASLERSHKSAAFSQVLFTDLMFENGEMDAGYLSVDSGERSYQEFQAQLDFYNCGEDSWALSFGTLDASRLCDGDTTLYIHPKDQDGGLYGGCEPGSIECQGAAIVTHPRAAIVTHPHAC